MVSSPSSRSRARRGNEYSSRKKGVDELFRTWQKTVLLLVVFGGSFLLYFALYFRPPLSGRALDLAQVARGLALGRGEVSAVVRPLDLSGSTLEVFPRWRYPWLYVRLLSLLMKPFGSDETTLALFTSFFFFLALALAAVFAFRFGWKRAALLAFALAFTSPVFLRGGLSGLPHTVLACFLLGALLCLGSLPSVLASLAAGLIAGAGVLIDYDWFLLAPLFVVYAWLCGGRWRRRDSLCVLLGLVLIVGPLILFSPGNPVLAHLRFQWLSRTELFPGRSLDLFYRLGPFSFRLPFPLLIGKLHRGLTLAYAAGLNFSGNFLAPLFLVSLFFRLEDAALRRLRRLLVALMVAAGFWSAAGSQGMEMLAVFIPAAAFFAAAFLLRFFDKWGFSSPRSRRALFAGIFALNIFPVLVSLPSSGESPSQLLAGLNYVRGVTRAEEVVASNEPEVVSWYTQRRAVQIPVNLSMMKAMIGDYGEIKFLLLTPRILSGAGDDPTGSWRGVYNQAFFPELAGWDQTVVLPGPLVLKGEKDLLLYRVSARW